MLINSIDSTAFGVNLNSPKLRFSQKDFYVKIRGYGNNYLWAEKTLETANTAVKMIRKNTSAENVLKFISTGISKANKFCLELFKRSHSGILRIPREGWKSEEICYDDLWTGYGEKTRYREYRERFNKIAFKKLQNPYNNIGLTRPRYDREVLRHGKAEYVNNALDCVFELSKKIFPKYIHNEVKPKDMKEINKTIAEIRWVLAHSTPWTRGSDAISNVFMRAIYKAIGIKTYPLKKGISLDLEAYCMELSDYKEKFATYFEKPPEIVE